MLSLVDKSDTKLSGHACATVRPEVISRRIRYRCGIAFSPRTRAYSARIAVHAAARGAPGWTRDMAEPAKRL